MLTLKRKLSVAVLFASASVLAFSQDQPAQNPVVPPATITGSGTTNSVPKFTGAATIGNSAITDNAGRIGINLTSPAARFDVAGTAQIRDTLTLAPAGTHPTLTIKNTTFSVNNLGRVSFIAGQHFPGTVTKVNAGTGLSGGGTGTPTLSLNTTFTDGRYAQLAVFNTFTADQQMPDLFLTGFLSSGNIFSLDMFPTTVNPSTGDARAVVADNNGVTQTVQMQNFTTGFGFIEAQFNSAGTATFFTDNAGNTTAIGTKSAAVPLGNGKMVKVFSVESPEVWFEDFGSARVYNGLTTVTLDERFVQTVDMKGGYHVFLTPKGDCKGLYVTNETATGFEVREMGGGAATVDFDYRIVAHRSGYQATRLPAAGLPRIGHLTRPARPASR